MRSFLDNALISITVDDGKPYDPGNYSQNYDSWDKDGRDLVGITLNRCLGILCIFDKLHDLVECGVFSNLLYLDDQRSLCQNSSSKHFLTYFLLDWLSFSSKHRLIAASPTKDDEAISGDSTTWLYHDKVFDL